MQELTKWIPVAQVGKILGMSRQRVFTLIHTGRLEATMFGPVWAVDCESVANFEPKVGGRRPKSKQPLEVVQ